MERVEAESGLVLDENQKEYVKSLVTESYRRGREQGIREVREIVKEERDRWSNKKWEEDTFGTDEVIECLSVFVNRLDSLLSQQEEKQ